MSAEVMQLAREAAFTAGWDARRDGQGRDQCPYRFPELREVWQAGWTKANGRVF